MNGVTIQTLVARPDLVDRLYGIEDTWPEFMGHDPLANALFNRVAPTFPRFCVVATTVPDGAIVARGRAAPFAFGIPGRTELPDGGLDRAVVWAFRDHQQGRAATVACAVDITIDGSYTGKGLSHRMLAALAEASRKAGATDLVAPVRPTRKHLQPRQSIVDYVRQTRDDGLPVDPWLRVHVKAGGRIVKVAPTSMTMVGSLAEWRGWTGLPFDRTGDVVVPEALVPVHCDVTHDHAVYVEPNVWVWHDLGAA